jgi:rubrerythrin
MKGSQTEQNLLKSFAGESQARNRYEFFAKVAKSEGYEQISAIFFETANQEKQHAKRFFKFLQEGEGLEIVATFPAGKIGTTVENLRAAAMGEKEEWSELYPHFSEVALQEGFKDIAAAYKMIAKVEYEHEKRYLKLLGNIMANKVFQRDDVVKWVCRNCGYVHEGLKALDTCPACMHPKAFFELYAENY